MKKIIFALTMLLSVSSFASVNEVSQNFNESEKFPCGFKGSVEDRIHDCSYQQSSQKGNFVLVARTIKFKEVYMDSKTGLLWGDRLPSEMNHYDAQKACNESLGEVLKIKDLVWRLPTEKDYIQADVNGIRASLPNMTYAFWASTVSRHDSNLAYEFYGYINTTGIRTYNLRTYKAAVRCVAWQPRSGEL